MGDKKTVPAKSFVLKDEINCNEILAKNVKYARCYLMKPKMTKEKLAEKIDMSLETIKHIEKGKGAKADTLCKLSNVFHVSIDWLLTDHSSSEDINFTAVSSISKSLSEMESWFQKMSLQMEKYNDIMEKLDILTIENENLKKENAKLKSLKVKRKK